MVSKIILALVVAAALASSYLSSWGLLSPAGRAAKCWVQFEDAAATVAISLMLAAAGIALWVGAWLLANTSPRRGAVSLATGISVVILALTLLPFVFLSAYPLMPELRAECGAGQPSGLVVASTSLIPLLSLLMLAIAFRGRQRRSAGE